MKILCVIDSLGSGGAQRQLVGLAIGFKERGHEVSFLVYHGRLKIYVELVGYNRLFFQNLQTLRHLKNHEREVVPGS